MIDLIPPTHTFDKTRQEGNAQGIFAIHVVLRTVCAVRDRAVTYMQSSRVAPLNTTLL